MKTNPRKSKRPAESKTSRTDKRKDNAAHGSSSGYEWLRLLKRGDVLILGKTPVTYIGPIGLRGHIVSDGRYTIKVKRRELTPNESSSPATPGSAATSAQKGNEL